MDEKMVLVLCSTLLAAIFIILGKIGKKPEKKVKKEEL